MKTMNSLLLLTFLASTTPAQAAFIQGTYGQNYDPDGGTEFFTVNHPEDIVLFGNNDIQNLCYFGDKSDIQKIANEMVKVAIRHGSEEYVVGDAEVKEANHGALEVKYTISSDYDTNLDTFKLTPCDLEKSVQEKHFALRMRDQSQAEAYSSHAVWGLDLNTWVSYLEPKPSQRSGYTTVFVGKKKSNISSVQFKKKLFTHISKVEDAFPALGMNTYRVYALNGYEIAIQSWNSKEAFDQASKSPIAQAAFKEAQDLMTPLLFQEIR